MTNIDDMTDAELADLLQHMTDGMKPLKLAPVRGLTPEQARGLFGKPRTTALSHAVDSALDNRWRL